jgi:hypothetical protein
MRGVAFVVLWSGSALLAQATQKTPSIPAAVVEESMKLFNSALGVECTFCHVDKDWKDISKPQWAIARDMWRMVQALNGGPLDNTSGITCVTCHGGQNKPSRLPPDQWQAIAEKWPSKLAEDRKLAMSVYSASLGVGCEHCHDPADWKSAAKPTFATASRMNAMFDVFPRFMPAGARTQCYMCHKGSKHPGAAAPATV